MDVEDNGVQWGKYLRVKVSIDVTKRLIRAKKVSIEGEEIIWVLFKYERLLNFCYFCGLLCHDWKDCQAAKMKDKNLEQDNLHYGLWLRGEIGRRGIREVPRFSQNAETDGARELEKENRHLTVAERQVLTITVEIKKAPKSNVLTKEDSTMGKETKMLGELVECTEGFHKMGEVSRVESAPDKMPSNCGKEEAGIELNQKAIKGGMQWETATTQEENPKFIFKMRQNNIEAGPEESVKNLEDETSPIAMIYDKNEG